MCLADIQVTTERDAYLSSTSTWNSHYVRLMPIASASYLESKEGGCAQEEWWLANSLGRVRHWRPEVGRVLE